MAATEAKLNKLVDTFLDGDIEKPTYLKKKEELIKRKLKLKEEKRDFGRGGNNWLEPLKAWLEDAHHANSLTSHPDATSLKNFLARTATERRLRDKKVEIKWRGFWAQQAKMQQVSAREARGAVSAKGKEKSNRSDWSGRRESNSIYTVPNRACSQYTSPRILGIVHTQVNHLTPTMHQSLPFSQSQTIHRSYGYVSCFAQFKKVHLGTY